MPYYVRWPGKVPAGSVNDHLLYYPDLMPTLADLAGARTPETDGLSFLPTLVGQGKQPKHEILYWEFGSQTAVRKGHWKAFRNKKTLELYDLSKDVEELKDLAAEREDILRQLVPIAEEAHEPVRPGEVYDRVLIDKDRAQAPHNRKKK